jgi:hypothetical protein
VGQINTREICLLGPTAVTTSGTGPDINAIQGWQAAIVSVTVTTVTGTLPTFDVYVQKKLGQPASTDTSGLAPTGTAIYDDLLHFTQMTTTATRITQLVTGPQTPTANATLVTTADWAQQDAAIAAGDIRIGPIGGLWRVKYVISGTSPVGTLAVTVQLIPFGT